MDEQAPVAIDLIGRADKSYKPIVDFIDWSSLALDVQAWNTHLSIVQELGSANSVKLDRAREVAKRAAAIDTGAIEGLYQLDRGITITIAAQTAMWQVAFEKEQEKVRLLIESQLDAYDYVLDLATKSVPIAEAYIRELHRKICSAQNTFKALTSAGIQEQQLNHGEYKKFPNHVQKEDGTLHAYAPVQQTPMEMGRLCEIMRRQDFESAHPVLQAAYVHHAFTRIHPFQDGNGRVARALASIFLYRAASIPLLVLVDHRNAYIDALEAADSGECQTFVNFVTSRSRDAFVLVAESLRTAEVDDPVKTSRAIGDLYLTRGGYKHNQVDLAGQTLLHAVQTQIQKQVTEVPRAGELRFDVTRSGGDIQMPPTPDGYRTLVSIPKESIVLQAESLPPAATKVNRNLVIFVPRNCGRDDDIMILCRETNDLLRVPISSVLGKERMVTDLRVAIFSNRVLGEILCQLKAQAESELKRHGY
ncbi:Fic family protein [Nitrospira lenta]|nr:Fic family protein [Nitrospira lenta]